MSTTLDPSADPIVELMRLNKIVDGCESALASAERLAARGRPRTEAEIAEVRATLDKATRERDWIEGAIRRYCAQPS